MSWNEAMTVDLDPTGPLGGFRREARAWLEANVPMEARPVDGPSQADFDRAWQRRQHADGWAGIDWDVAYGGRGLSQMEQVVWYEELARAGAPSPGFSCLLVALNNVGPTLMLAGTAQQRREHLPRILSGDEVWCQAFSEPAAGSDLAALATRGVVDGDSIVINGQKIWTSFAQYSDYAEALVRTDAGATKHKGLTLVMIDMNLAGIEVRPIEQIDGNEEFCEVFFDDVTVPISDVIGEVGQGWNVALSTLALERGPAVLDMRLASITWTDALAAEVRARGLTHDDAIMDRLAVARADAAANRAMAYYQAARVEKGQVPGPETTAVRTFHVELEQRIARLGLDIMGSESLESTQWSRHWLHQFMTTIGGGTKDVQKNIIGERVLGLPR